MPYQEGRKGFPLDGKGLPLDGKGLPLAGKGLPLDDEDSICPHCLDELDGDGYHMSGRTDCDTDDGDEDWEEEDLLD